MPEQAPSLNTINRVKGMHMKCEMIVDKACIEENAAIVIIFFMPSRH